MKFIELANKRRSVRQYSEREISDELLLQIAEAGRLAPSAVNYQPWIFYIIKSEDGMNKLHESYNREWFGKCKYAILVCADKSQAWIRSSDQKSHADIDASIAIDHMTLQAADLGIGSCWICNFDPETLKINFGLTDVLSPIAIISLGYPADESIWEQPKKRKDISQITEWK